MVLINPLSMILYCIVLGIDICLFFLIVRLLVLWRNPIILEGLNHAGRPLVNGITNYLGNAANRLLCQQLSKQGKVAVSLAILSLTNLLLKKGLVLWGSA